MRDRSAAVRRATRETQVEVELNLDGAGTNDIDTGVPFFDHMLSQLGKHGSLNLRVEASGDTHIDAHHTVEDTAITLGEALREALGDKAGITRFGDALIPLDETLVRAAVDLAGRPYVVHSEPERMPPLIGSYDTTLDQALLRDPRCDRRDLRARRRTLRPQPAPHRRGAVQSLRPGLAHRCHSRSS